MKKARLFKQRKNDIMDFQLVTYFSVFRSARSVIFVGRSTETNEKHYFIVDDFYPYFGVPYEEKDIHKGHYSVVNIQDSYDIYGNKIAKITVKRTEDVALLKTSYTTSYESKTLFHERVKIDLEIKGGFTVPDNYINREKCFAKSCGGKTYHAISYKKITGW